MSIHVMAWVFDSAPEDSNPTEMLVMLALADHANPEGGLSYPSVERLARYCRISERTVQRTLRELVMKGVIEEQMPATNKRPTVYRFPNFSRGDNLTPQTPSRGDNLTPQTPLGVTNPASRGDTGDTRSVRTVKENKNDPPISPTGATHSPVPEKKSAQEEKETTGGFSPGGTTKLPVSNRVSSSEREHHYWTDPAHRTARLDFFRAVFGQYPKQENELDAMAAWRQVIGTRLDGGADREMIDAIWFAAQWYARKVKGLLGDEPTAPRYVAGFGNWIRGERWNDAPEYVRRGKPTP